MPRWSRNSSIAPTRSMPTSIEDLMNRDNRNALIAAACFMLIFGFAAFYLPTVMVAVGNVSTIAAGGVAILFVGAFFGVFWLRGRSQNRRER
jgi:drug/metabolite transporter (DMT)-like permease